MYKAKQDKRDLAMQFLSQSAEQGNVHAQWELGTRYKTAEGVKQDSAQAAAWFKKAADQGLAGAQYDLALCYQTGDGVGKNLDKAVELFEKSAAQGHPESKLKVAECKAELIKHKTELIKYKAESGDNESMYELGIAFLHGTDGLKKDEEKALYWLSKSAENGHTKAHEKIKLFHSEQADRVETTIYKYEESLKRFTDKIELFYSWLEAANSMGVDSYGARKLWDESHRKYNRKPLMAVLKHGFHIPRSPGLYSLKDDVNKLAISHEAKRSWIERIEKVDSLHEQLRADQSKLLNSNLTTELTRAGLGYSGNDSLGQDD
jgi:TPR repeat protein